MDSPIRLTLPQATTTRQLSNAISLRKKRLLETPGFFHVKFTKDLSILKKAKACKKPDPSLRFEARVRKITGRDVGAKQSLRKAYCTLHFGAPNRTAHRPGVTNFPLSTWRCRRPKHGAYSMADFPPSNFALSSLNGFPWDFSQRVFKGGKDGNIVVHPPFTQNGPLAPCHHFVEAHPMRKKVTASCSPLAEFHCNEIVNCGLHPPKLT